MRTYTTDWIDVPSKRVRTESENEAIVQPFRISRFPIRRSEFARFCDATGYATTAERAGSHHNFRRNDAIEAMSADELAAADACCISWHDADRFSAWAGVRLPTEHEWLAAAILDWSREYDEGHYERAIQSAFLDPNALRNVGLEWMLTPRTDQAVLRVGPLYALKALWHSEQPRVVRPRDWFDLTTVFRVVG